MVEPEAITDPDAPPAPDPTVGNGFSRIQSNGPDDALRSSLGFDRDDDGWLTLVRQCTEPAPLGRLGRYELLEEIGRGAQGTVYRAVQPGTNRRIALKRLAHGALAGKTARARFEREVEAAAALSHPGIVSVLGADEVDGHAVLLMELVEGTPIDRWAAGLEKSAPSGAQGDAAARPMAESLRAFVQVCDAVAHAHQRGVLHRDLKPSNILVDNDGRARVLDFGLAKVLGEPGSTSGTLGASGSSAGRPSLSAEGAFMGTPAYAAPEQVAGLRAEIDTRTDVYALGVLLYKLLTGTLPFGGDDGAQPLAALFDRIRAGTFRRPSQVAPRSVNDELNAIVLKAMALEPVRRYQSVDALAADVRRYLAGETVLAHPPSAAYQLRKWVRRHRALAVCVLAAVAAVTLLAAISTVLAWRLTRERAQLSATTVREQAARVAAQDAQRAETQQRQLADKKATEAVEAGERARLQAQRAQAVNTFLNRMIAGAPTEGPGDSETRLSSVLADAERELDSGSLKDQPDIESRLRRSIGAGYNRVGDAVRAARNLQRALELAMGVYGRKHRTVAVLYNELGATLSRCWRLPEAEAALRESIAIREELWPGDHAQQTGPMSNLAALLIDLDRLDEAEALHTEVLALNIKRDGARAASAGVGLKNLGLIRYARGDWAGAEELHRKALDIYREAYPPSDDHIPGGLVHLGRALARQGRLDEAEPLMREALAIRESVFPADHPQIGNATAHLGYVLWERGKLSEAEAMLRRTVTIERARAQSAHPLWGRHAVALGEVVLQQGRPDEAEALIADGIAVLRRAPSLSSWIIDVARGAHGQSLCAMGRAGEGLSEVIDAYLRVCESDGDSEHPDPKAELGARLLDLIRP